MRYHIPYGKQTLTLSLPARFRVRYYAPPEQDAALWTDARIRAAIREFLPFAFSRSSGQGDVSVAIAINDNTRPPVQKRILPLLCRELHEYFSEKFEVIICIANGLHPPMSAAEVKRIIPDECARHRIIQHNARAQKTLVWLGRSAAGTPMWINGTFSHATYKATISSVDGHQFAGVTGGAKMVAIGLGGVDTITHNHSRYHHEDARLGNIVTNPVRKDIEEIGAKAHIDMQINCALNGAQEIVDLQIFNHEQRNGTTTFTEFAHGLLRRRALQSAGGYDCVITSAGGAPKDGTLYQLQKALAHTAPLAKPVAPIILCGACAQGVGDDAFQHHFSSVDSIAQVLERTRWESFQVGPHKSTLFARDMHRRPVALVSDLTPTLVKRMHFIPLRLTRRAVSRFLRSHHVSASARIAVVPFAVSSYFEISS